MPRAKLAAMPKVHLISLHRGPTQTPPSSVARSFTVIEPPGIEATAGPFMDISAIMKGLELVVTVDTSTAHLAGALGVPVWVALPFAPSWRWMLNRSDSPWYPTMRLFRQERPGDWDGVFTRIATEFRGYIAARAPDRSACPPWPW